MFGLSMWEVVLILVVALIALGPKQLAETAKVVGRMYRQLQNMASDVRSSIDLDNITAPPEPPKHSPPSPPPANLFPKTGEKTGPDFYAELLEQSRREEAPPQEETALEKLDEDKSKNDSPSPPPPEIKTTK